jgi:RND family efflux transporter MFP subunit
MKEASIAAAIFMCFAGMLTAPAMAEEQPPQSAQAQDQTSQTVGYKVAEQEIDDLKAVFATVRSKDRIEARVRTGGTIASLKVDEGVEVKPGQVLAVIADPKIALKIKALSAQIVAAKSSLKTAKLEYDRASRLRKQGVITQARLDQLKTAFDVATNNLKAVEAERAVAERQIEEGQVLAPAGGRVLQVPVTEGSVVLMGESVATIAANGYLLRLELPERHARFMEKGAKIKVGARGLSPDNGVIGEGRIIQVYPEVQHGRVIADAEVSRLGTYFVGERTLVWIPAGKRKTIVVPRKFTFQRFGLDYVKVASEKGDPLDVVVQLGNSVTLEDNTPAVEVLTGLKLKDQLVQP